MGGEERGVVKGGEGWRGGARGGVEERGVVMSDEECRGVVRVGVGWGWAGGEQSAVGQEVVRSQSRRLTQTSLTQRRLACTALILVISIAPTAPIGRSPARGSAVAHRFPPNDLTASVAPTP